MNIFVLYRSAHTFLTLYILSFELKMKKILETLPCVCIDTSGTLSRPQTVSRALHCHDGSPLSPTLTHLFVPHPDAHFGPCDERWLQ